MAVVIDEVSISDNDIRADVGTEIRVNVSSDTPTIVIAYFTDTNIAMQLREYAPDKWYVKVWGSRVGECTNSTIEIFVTDGTTVATDSSMTITVTDNTYPDPSKFTQSLIENNWDKSRANGTDCPQVVCITDVKRINRDDDWILILEGDRGVQSRARGYYQNIRYPVTIEIHAKDRTRSRYLLKEVDRILEEYWNNLNSYQFDYIEFTNKGRDVSMASAKIWKFIYNIVYVKIYEPKEGVT